MQTSRLTASVLKATPKSAHLSPRTREKIRLIAVGAASHYSKRGRVFSWRHESNPYRLAIAEILLQKTRAASVQPVYEHLITRFPAAIDLAQADEATLEVLLRPLGLSRKRALQLRSMAGEVTSIGPTAFADWRVLLEKVPGIGSYGARAIACFSRGEHLGLVDANIARIFRRVFRVPSADPRAAVYQQLADAVAIASIAPRSTNFGLLDIGATVCISKPRCSDCPFREFCPRYGVKAKANLKRSE